MKTRFSRCTAALGLIAGLTLAVAAQAAPTYETYTSSGTTSGGAATFNATGGSVTVSSATGAYFASGSSSKWVVNPVVGATTNSSALVYYAPGGGTNYGFGMDSDGSTAPNHALDNNGNTEAVLLNFSSAVALTNINLGYVSNGSASNTPGAIVGVSLFRWTGTGAPPSLNGVSVSAMGSWQLVGNYADGYGSNNADLLGETSSWWLVSAYNTVFGTAQETVGASSLASTVNDSYFKLFSVGSTVNTTTSKTPEPGSMALAGIALLGAVWTSRRRKA